MYLFRLGHELLNLVTDLVSDAPENFCFLAGQSIVGIWIDDTPVQNAEGEGEYRTSFLSGITDGDHGKETLFK